MVQRKKRNAVGSLLLMAGGFSLVILAIGWYLLLINPRQSGATHITPTSEGSFPQVIRISPEDAKRAHDQGTASFIDVRSVEEYQQERIRGALSIPLLELPERLRELDPNLWYITYCT